MLKEHLLRYLSKPESLIYSSTAMAVVVEAKRASRLAKGLAFNCLVLDRGTHIHHAEVEIDRIEADSAVSKEKPVDELGVFLGNLSEGKRKAILPNGTRYQVIYRDADHWSVLDIALIDGDFSVFLVDSAFSLDTLLDVMALINSLMPSSKIYLAGGFQKDRVSCSMFSFDAACCLARFHDVHQQLAAMSIKKALGSFSGYADYIRYIFEQDPSLKVTVFEKPFLGGFAAAEKLPRLMSALEQVNLLGPKDFTPSFAPLLRNIQGTRELDFYVKTNPALLHAPVTYVKPCTLEAKVLRDRIVTFENGMFNPPVVRSAAIDKIREKANKKACTFLSSVESVSSTAAGKDAAGAGGAASTPDAEINILSFFSRKVIPELAEAPAAVAAASGGAGGGR